MADIIKELSETDLKIAKLERAIKFLKKKCNFLASQMERQININDGFIRMFEKLNIR